MSTVLLSLQSPAAFLPPNVRFFAGRSESFIQFGSDWRRATPEDEAKMHSGHNRETHEPCIGVYVVRRPNGLLCVGFDLWKLNVNLRPAAIERLQSRWRQQATSLSKSMLRSVLRRSHFSKSFARFEISSEHVEEWKSELAAVLSNPDSFEPLDRNNHANPGSHL
jgi:hypothetical protein